jgi:hypothetical protein
VTREQHRAAAVGPVARDRHDAIGHVPPARALAQVLLRRQDDAVAPRGIARLIYDEHATGLRAEIRMGFPPLQPATIQGLGVGRARRA